MNNNITTITTLYKTPSDKLKNLNQYNSFKLKIFEQEGSLISKKKLQKILNRKFDYYYSKISCKNIWIVIKLKFLSSIVQKFSSKLTC